MNFADRVAALRAFPPLSIPEAPDAPPGWPEALVRYLMSSSPDFYGPTTRVFDSVAALQAAVIDDAGAKITSVVCLGYAAPFDGGRREMVYSPAPVAGAVVSADGARWRLAAEVANPVQFGAPLDGSADATAALQAAIDALPASGGVVYTPGGVLRLDAPVYLRSNVHLLFADTEIDATLNPTNVFVADGTMARIRNISAVGMREVRMSHAGGPDNNDGGFVMLLRRVTKARLGKVRVKTGKLLKTDLRVGFPERFAFGILLPDISPERIGVGVAAETAMADELCYDVQIADFEAEGTPGVSDIPGASGCIALRYCSKFSIERGKIRYYASGIWGSGGDANPNRDGSAQGARWVRGGVVFAVETYDIAAGGIWFSNAELTKVIACHAERCLDYGLHTEGNRHVTFEACTTLNCVRGAGGYFIDNEVVFIGCHLFVDNPPICIGGEGRVVMFKSNNGFATDGLSLWFSGGSMTVTNITDPAHQGVILTQMGGIVGVRDTVLTNVVVDYGTSNSGSRVLEDIRMRFTEDPGVPFVAITGGGGVYGSSEIGLNNSGAGIRARRVVAEHGFTPAAGSAFADVSAGNSENVFEDCDAGAFQTFAKARSQTSSGAPTLRLGRNRFPGAAANYVVDDDVLGHGNLLIRGLLRGQIFWNWPTVPAGATVKRTATVKGASVGDHVDVWMAFPLQGTVVSAFVDADDTATVQIFNPTGADIDFSVGKPAGQNSVIVYYEVTTAT